MRCVCLFLDRSVCFGGRGLLYNGVVVSPSTSHGGVAIVFLTNCMRWVVLLLPCVLLLCFRDVTVPWKIRTMATVRSMRDK